MCITGLNVCVCVCCVHVNANESECPAWSGELIRSGGARSWEGAPMEMASTPIITLRRQARPVFFVSSNWIVYWIALSARRTGSVCDRFNIFQLRGCICALPERKDDDDDAGTIELERGRGGLA